MEVTDAACTIVSVSNACHFRLLYSESGPAILRVHTQNAKMPEVPGTRNGE